LAILKSLNVAYIRLCFMILCRRSESLHMVTQFEIAYVHVKETEYLRVEVDRICKLQLWPKPNIDNVIGLIANVIGFGLIKWL